jgi:hypothetical protein
MPDESNAPNAGRSAHSPMARGGSPYDVAKLLGDTIETIEKHYTPFVRELRERVRRLMENGEGLENWAQFGHSDSQTATKKQTTN